MFLVLLHLGQLALDQAVSHTEDFCTNIWTELTHNLAIIF